MLEVELNVEHSAFVIPHSIFDIRHSSFDIRDGPPDVGCDADAGFIRKTFNFQPSTFNVQLSHGKVAKNLGGSRSQAAMMVKVMEDLQLLRDYAEHRSEPAFSELVHRHMDLVYSTALRLVHESQLAEDVTQMVFIRLARKAGSLRHGTVLTGWLYRTTQFVAQTALRTDWRRRQRETLAMQFTELDRDNESVWKEVAPLLEQGVTQLRQADQDAVLLRFFAGKSLREVGQALGISDDAAQKRVNRALERMRDYFALQGVTVSVALIAPAIAAHAVQTAPAALAGTLVAASLTGGPAGGIGAFTTLNVLKAMAVAKLKTTVAGVLGTIILVSTCAMFVARMRPEETKTGAAATATGQPPAGAFTLRGTVRAPDGNPLAGALVRVATPQAYVRLYQTTNAVAATNRPAALTSKTNAPQLARAPLPAPATNTAADGSFVISLPEPPKDGLAAVVVNSDAGYALVTAEQLTTDPDVMVKPWARIEGVLRIGKSLASNETVNIGIWGATELYDWNLVQHGASTKTDANGRFVFPRVAPIDVWLTRTVMVRTNDGRQSGHQYVKLLPGDRLQVQLGGLGHALTGRVEWDSTNKLVFYGSMWADQEGGIRHPRGWKNMSREEQRNYERAWRDSPESDLFKDSVRNYEFPILPDRTFRVDDVLPGNYRMQVRADEPVPGGKGMRHAAAVELRVHVPELSGGVNAEPIDVGTLTPQRVLYR